MSELVTTNKVKALALSLGDAAGSWLGREPVVVILPWSPLGRHRVSSWNPSKPSVRCFAMGQVIGKPIMRACVSVPRNLDRKPDPYPRTISLICRHWQSAVPLKARSPPLDQGRHRDLARQQVLAHPRLRRRQGNDGSLRRLRREGHRLG